MANEPTPTDAEIDEIYRATFLGMPNVARQPLQTVPPMVRDFARAVLARWGVLRADKIVIPTDTMEQEFKKHYRRGYEAGLRAQPAPAASQKPPTQVQAGAVPLTERQIAQCIVSAGCVGTVKMSFESGPYSIDRPTLNATKLVQSIEAAHGIGIKGGRNVDHPV